MKPPINISQSNSQYKSLGKMRRSTLPPPHSPITKLCLVYANDLGITCALRFSTNKIIFNLKILSYHALFS